MAAKRRHIWLSVLLLIVLLPLLLVLGVIGFVASPWGEEVVRQQAVHRAEAATGLRVEIDQIETSVLSSVTVTGLRAWHPEVADTLDLVSIDRLHLRYRLLPLLHRQVQVDTLAVDGLRGHVVMTADGQLNLPVFPADSSAADSTVADSLTTAESDSASTPWEIHVGGARVSVVRAEYRDEQQHLAAAVDSFTVHANGDPALYRYRFGFRGASLQQDARTITLDDFLMTGRVLDLDTLRVDSLRLAMPGADLAGRADAEIVPGADSSQAVDAGIELHADLHRLSRLISDLIPPDLQPIYGDLAIGIQVSGSADKPEGRVSLNAPSLQAGPYRVDNLALFVRGSQETVSLDSLSLFAFGGSLAGRGHLELLGNRDHVLDLTMEGIDLETVQRTFVPQPDPADSAAALPTIAGTFRGSVHSAGPLHPIPDIEARTNLIADVIEPGGNTPASYQIQARYGNKSGSAVFRRANTSVRTTLRQDSFGSYAGEFTVNMPNLDQITGPLGIDGLTGNLSGSGSFSGLPAQPRVNAFISSNQIDYQGALLDTLYATARFDTSGLVIDQAGFGGIIAQIDSSSGPVGLVGVDASDVTYSGEVNGTIDDLRGQIDLDAADLRFQDLHADDLDVKVLLRGKQVNLAWLRVEKDQLRMSASGSLDLTQLAGGVDVWFTDRRPKGDDDDDDDEDSNRSTQAAVDRSSSTSITGDGRLRMTFNLPDSLSETVELHGEGGRIPLGHIPRVHPALEELRGELGINLAFVGTPTRPSGRIRLTLDSLRTTQVVVDSMQLAGRFNHESLDASLRARLAGSLPIRARVSLPLEVVNGTIQPAMDKELSAAVSAKSVDLPVLNELLPPGMALRGLASFDYTATGTLRKPRLRGEVRLDSGLVDLGDDIEPLDSINVLVRQQDSLLVIDRLSTYTMGNRFDAGGRVRILADGGAEGKLSLDVSGQRVVNADGRFEQGAYTAELEIPGFTIEPVAALVEGVNDTRGLISGYVTVSGDTSMAIPNVTGRLKGEKVRIVIADVRERIANGVFDIEFTNNSVAIDTLGFDFSDEPGRWLSIAGGVELRDTTPWFDLTANGRNLKMDRKDEFEVTVDRVKMAFQTQASDHHTLTGDVWLGKTRYEQDWRLDTILRQINAAPTSRAVSQTNDLVNQIYLDVRLREAENIQVDNNLADLRLTANLQGGGTVAAPVITGRVAVNSGYVNYLDQRFTVVEGVIDFVDTAEIDPYLNITATSEIVDFSGGERITYDVTLTITGNARNANVEFISEPYLDQTSIISLITLGSAGGGGVSSAGSLAGRALSGYVGARVGSAVGLDQLSLQGNVFASGNEGQAATLTATKEISDRAEISYITNVRTFSDNKIRVSYYITDRWTLTGETNQEGEGSLDARFRIRWNEIRFK